MYVIAKIAIEDVTMAEKFESDISEIFFISSILGVSNGLNW